MFAVKIALALTIGIPSSAVSLSGARVEDVGMRRNPYVRQVRKRQAKQHSKPNILYILLDDFGWADAGWHNGSVTTPNMDALVKAGVELNRHYTFHSCSPTRSAIQTGRSPLHVNVERHLPLRYNPNDPESGFSGIPRNMTSIATIMRDRGYRTHMYGKWDVGLTTHDQAPPARGYMHSLVSAGHGGDPWTYKGLCDKIELLYDGGSPAAFLEEVGACKKTCQHEEKLFQERVLWAVNLESEMPFFIMWSPHLGHERRDVPRSYLQLPEFKDMTDTKRKTYFAMMKFVDDEIGEVITALHKRKLYQNTLIIVHSDNGGQIVDYAANNWPLRGGKWSNWEGGIRVAAFVSGGLVPAQRRGSKLDTFMTAWDWYATLAYLAGAADDNRLFHSKASAASMDEVHSFNMWPAIIGETSASPRTTMFIGDEGAAVVGMISDTGNGLFKLLLGRVQQNFITPEEGLAHVSRGPTIANIAKNCSYEPDKDTACLFDLSSDPREETNIAHLYVDLFKEMKMAIEGERLAVFNPDRGVEDTAAACANQGAYFGPWVTSG